MKVTIRYEYIPQYENKYFAKVNYNGSYICKCGDSWEKARLEMIATLKRLEEEANDKVPVPPSEDVELNIPEEEVAVPEVSHVS